MCRRKSISSNNKPLLLVDKQYEQRYQEYKMCMIKNNFQPKIIFFYTVNHQEFYNLHYMDNTNSVYYMFKTLKLPTALFSGCTPALKNVG